MTVGDVVSSFTSPVTAPYDLAWDGANLWLASANNNTIYKLNPATGATVTSFAGPGSNPRGLAWDGTNLWVSDGNTRRIYKIATSGSVVSSFALPANPSTGIPDGLAWDGTHLWYSDSSDEKIRRVTTTGTLVTTYAAPTNNPAGLAWDTGGFLWVVHTFGTAVYKVNPATGVTVTSFGGPATSHRGLAWQDAGAFLWVSADGNDTIYKLEGPVYNTAPNVPILTTPADGATIDRTSVNRFDWDFSDPDTGDSQSAYNLRYRLVGAPSWTETGWQSLPNTYHDIAAGTFAAGDYEWQAATKDAQGVEGPFSASSFFTAATAPAAPTITAPINGATFSQSETVTWSAPDQDAYQLRILDDADTLVSDTGEVTSSTTRSLVVTFPVNNVPRKIQVRIKDNGLWSPYYAISGNVSWTPPQTPVVTLTPDAATGSLAVGIINPAPGAGQPTTSYNDVYVDDGDGEERRATMLTPNTPWVYRLPVSGREYDGAIRVVAVGDNGTTASSS